VNGMWYSLGALGLMALAGCAQRQPQAGLWPEVPRNRLLLNGVWEFAAAPDGDVPTDGWQKVRVPHRSREFEEAPPESGWYRTQLRVPAAWREAEGRIVLDLSRVRHYARVYVAGQPVGEHYGMRTPFRIDITDAVQPGKTCLLLIYTHNCSGRYAHPSGKVLSKEAAAALDTRFWYTSAHTVGVEGDVWLCLEPSVRIEDVYVVTSVRRGHIAADVTVRNETDEQVRCRLDCEVTRKGRVELQLPVQPATLGPHASQVVRVEADWPDAVVWGRPPYGEPVLYFLRAELHDEGADRTGDARVQRFGFREVWTEGDQILLNGKPLFTWGDHSIPYVHERQWLTRKLPDLAAGNVSTLEHHRFDAPPVLYEVADELGAFIVSSNFCVGTGQVPAGLPPDEMNLVLESHLRVVDSWVRRDRNHPSLLFWDVTDTWLADFCVPMMKKVKQLDRTRIVEVTYRDAPPEIVELIDAYRLFSGRDQINAAIESIRSSKTLPVKPIRVGEAGIFSKQSWGFDEAPPISDEWVAFLESVPARRIRGLHTFSLTDMDYRGFTLQIPGMLSAPVSAQVTWPSQSGTDARIAPFGGSTPDALGKAALYVNWCDPARPVSLPTPTRAWWRSMFRKLTGRDVGPLAKKRVPEVIVTVRREGKPVAGAHVFVRALEGQGLEPYGVKADERGTSWFVLPEAGLYRFTCAEGALAGSVDVECRCHKIDVRPGYSHVQHADIELAAPPGRDEAAVAAAPAE